MRRRPSRSGQRVSDAELLTAAANHQLAAGRPVQPLQFSIGISFFRLFNRNVFGARLAVTDWRRPWRPVHIEAMLRPCEQLTDGGGAGLECPAVPSRIMRQCDRA